MRLVFSVRSGPGRSGSILRSLTLGALALAVPWLAGCETGPGEARIALPAIGTAARQAPAPSATAPVAVSSGPQLQAFIDPADGPAIGAPGRAETTADGRYSINFTDASLPEVVQTILGDLLGERFLLDPRVQGRVTIASSSPLSREALFALLETAARTNGVSLTRRDGIWIVAPIGDGATGLGRLMVADAPGMGITAFPLEHVSASAIQSLLDGVATRPGMLRADPARNLILIQGSGPERRAMAEMLDAFDVDWLQGRATALLPIRNAAASDVAQEILQILDAGEGGHLAGAIRVQPVERLNSVLVVAASNALLDETRAWIQRLDVAASSNLVLDSYPIENGEAEVAATLLRESFGLSGGTSSRSSVAPGLETSTVASPDAAPPRPAASGSAALAGAPELRLIADPLNNTLLVLASPAGHAMVSRALTMIDRAPTQVLLDAMIAEVSLNDTLRYGVQWFFETNGIDGIADSGRGGFGESGFDPGGSFPGFNFLLESQDNARLAIDALSAVTDLRIISSPSIVVLNNRTATLNVGDQVPIVTRSASSVIDPDSPIVNSVEFRDTGVILTVTPQVSSTGMVTLEIEQEISSVANRPGQAGTGVAGNPTISQRSIVTTVNARSGQTVALGGLIDDTRDDQQTGVPGLSRLPVVGAAFRTQNIQSKRTELLIFITPRIIYDDQDAAAAMLELRDRFSLMRPEEEDSGGE